MLTRARIKLKLLVVINGTPDLGHWPACRATNHDRLTYLTYLGISVDLGRTRGTTVRQLIRGPNYLTGIRRVPIHRPRPCNGTGLKALALHGESMSFYQFSLVDLSNGEIDTLISKQTTVETQEI